jgi:hypothetical protein
MKWLDFDGVTEIIYWKGFTGTRFTFRKIVSDGRWSSQSMRRASFNNIICNSTIQQMPNKSSSIFWKAKFPSETFRDIFIPSEDPRYYNKICSVFFHKDRIVIIMARSKLCFSLFWLVLLVVLIWPLALVVSVFWIILQPFESCCPCFRSINHFLERLVTWPREFGNSIATGSPNCPHP